jgi:hypothetical protein
LAALVVGVWLGFFLLVLPLGVWLDFFFVVLLVVGSLAAVVGVLFFFFFLDGGGVRTAGVGWAAGEASRPAKESIRATGAAAAAVVFFDDVGVCGWDAHAQGQRGSE